MSTLKLSNHSKAKSEYMYRIPDATRPNNFCRRKYDIVG